jgi:hypothetical protein
MCRCWVFVLGGAWPPWAFRAVGRDKADKTTGAVLIAAGRSRTRFPDPSGPQFFSFRRRRDWAWWDSGTFNLFKFIKD